MMSEFITGVVLACLIVAALCGGINWAHSSACETKWAESPYPHTKYGFVAGCRVSKDGKTYLPSTSVREF